MRKIISSMRPIFLPWRLCCFAALLIASCIGYSQQPSPLARKAIDLQRQHRLSEAEKAWEAVTQQTPKDPQAWANLGLMRAMQEHYAQAVSAYSVALKLNPKIPGLQLNLGLAYLKQNKLEESIEPLKAAVAQDPDNPQPNILLGTVYNGLSRFADAIPYLQRAITSTPDNLQLRLSLAQNCLSVHQYDCTLTQYKTILLQDPDSAQAHILAAEALDGLDRTNESLEEFRAAEKADPNLPNVHYGVAFLLWKQGRMDEAETEFKLQLQNVPKHAPSLAYLGDIALKRNDQTVALTYLNQATAQPDAIRLAFLDRGIARVELHQDQPAIDDFQRAIEMDPTKTDAHWRLARLYKSMGKTKEASEEMAAIAKLGEQTNQPQKTPQP